MTYHATVVTRTDGQDVIHNVDAPDQLTLRARIQLIRDHHPDTVVIDATRDSTAGPVQLPVRDQPATPAKPATNPFPALRATLEEAKRA